MDLKTDITMSLSTILLIIMLVLVFRVIIMGVPVMLALLGVPLVVACVGIIFGVFDASLFSAIPNRIYGIIGNQLLYAVPMFVLMGKLLQHSKIAEELLFLMSCSFKNHPMSLAYCVLGVSVILATSSGIVGATITMLAAIAVPAMLNSGYSEKFSAGLVCAAGSLGQILPPSIVLILLSDQVSNAHIASELQKGNFSPDPVSVGHLFAASLIPGLILAACYGVYIAFSKRHKLSPSQDINADETGSPNIIVSILTLATLICIPLSIILGIASASESAIVGVVLVLIIMIIKGAYSALSPALKETIEITGVIFGIILAASVFSLVIRGFGGDELLTGLFQELPGGFYLPLMVVMLMVFILGFVMEFVEITYIIVPITAPILFGLGIDPIWFAILMAINLQISFLTPPLGIALFYYKSVQPIVMQNLACAIIPFVVIQILVLMVLVIFPSLATWLPSVIL